MKNTKYLGKIGAGFLVVMLIMTGIVSAISLSDMNNESYEWLNEIVNSTQTKPSSASLVFDGNDVPHIFCITTNNELKHFKKINGTWQSESIDTKVTGGFVSAKIDSLGSFHVSYGKGKLYYITSKGTGWSLPQIVDSNVILTEQSCISLGLDSFNKPHISYYDSVKKDLKYANKAGLIWNIITVDSLGDVGGLSSLALDSINRVHIAYTDDTNFDLKYALKSKNIWQISTIDTNNYYAVCPSIAIDAFNQPHIVHGGYIGIKHTYKTTSGIWESEIVDPDETQCFCPSIVIDSNNSIQIGYSKTAPGGPDLKFDLMYAKKGNKQWQFETVVDAVPYQFLAYGISLNIDSGNNPYMSYVDFIGEKSLECASRVLV